MDMECINYKSITTKNSLGIAKIKKNKKKQSSLCVNKQAHLKSLRTRESYFQLSFSLWYCSAYGWKKPGVSVFEHRQKFTFWGGGDGFV